MGPVGSACSGSSSAGTSPVQWLGLDTRPLAVGSQIPVSLQFATDGGEVEYTATSSDSSIVAVNDLKDQEIVLSVLATGTATLQVVSNFGTATRPVIAEEPASVTFAVASRLKAGFDTALPSSENGFALVYDGSEVIQALVYDQVGDQLNSWGLTLGASTEVSVLVTKAEPEQFTLTAQASVPTSANFIAAIPSLGDAGTSSFLVSIVNSAQTGAIAANDAGVAIAEAFAAVPQLGQLQVFGLGDWQFTCQPAAQCTTDQVSLSAAQLSFPPGADAGSFTVTATVPVSPGSATSVVGSAQLPL
jgi:hypothetical protein